MLVTHDEATIIAHCTPKGSGAIALIRMSGVYALDIASSMGSLASKKQIVEVPSHTIHYGTVVDKQGVCIDRVLFMVMHGPKTFTGQDTVEISCHNNPFIIEAIINHAIEAGARLACAGEFTKRALLNKKIDLIQAEAINDLIHANTQHVLKQSLAQLDGSLSQWIHHIEQKLLKTIALSEASFEFIEEESLEFGNSIKTIINDIIQDIKTVKKTFDQNQQIRQGIRIALIGSVNAGKSTLFNMIIGQDRAIVTDTAGTTRDVIEHGMYRSGNYWTLIDTAGLRQTNHTIEKEGVKRAHQEAQKADVVLLVIDGSRALTQEEEKMYRAIYKNHLSKIILVKTKSDLPQCSISIAHKNNQLLTTSQNDNNSIQQLQEAVQSKISRTFDTLASPFLLNQRQFHLLLQLERKLLDMIPFLEGDIQYELLSYHLNDSLSQLAELTGKTVSKEAMDAIFQQFCVGK